MKRVGQDEKGMILLLVLVIVVLLTSLVVEFSFSTYVQIRLTETFRDGVKAYYLAKGGLQGGRMVLQNDTNAYDAHTETWGRPWENLAVADGAVSLRIEDLDGRLNVNRLVTDLGNVNVQVRARFIRFFENFGADNPEELTDALIDWLDPDSDPQPFGAEGDYYLREKKYSCKNARLHALQEMLKIKGFNEDFFKKIRPHLTVDGGEKINVNTATPEVLMSLSDEMTEEAAAYIVTYRKNSPFEKIADVRDVPGIPENIYFSIKSSLTVKSNFFRILSRAKVNDTGKRIYAVLQKDNNRLLSFEVK